jgi:Ca-activated chloride channel family protein
VELDVITFANPWALALAPLVLLLPLQPRWTGVARLEVPGPGVLRPPNRWRLRTALRHLPRALQMAGLLALLVALARPQRTWKDTRVTSEGLDIMLAIDTSQSMSERDFVVRGEAVDRLSVAKGVIAQFVEERPHDRVGVVLFGEEAFTHVPLTLDHTTLQAVLADVQLGVAGGGSTAVGTAIAVASKRMKDLDAPSRVVILVTDGRSNAGRFTPEQAAQLAADLGIKVYTIGVGGGAGAGLGGMFRQMLGGSDGVDEPTLRAVAERTGAKFFRAKDTSTLVDVYREIDELEPSPAEVEEIAHHDELFARALMPAALLLALAQALSATWLRRAP